MSTAQARPTVTIPFVLVGLLIAAQGASAKMLIGAADATRLGLQRTWFSQAMVDPTRNRVVGAAVEGDTLTVLMDSGVLQAFDAATGVARWTEQLGDSTLLNLGPAISAGRIGVASGSTLYVLDASNGRELLRKRLNGAPGATPAFTDTWVFTPLVTGMIQGVALDGAAGQSWNFAGAGAVYEPPIVTGDRLVWATSKGHLYGAYAVSGRLIRPARLGRRHRSRVPIQRFGTTDRPGDLDRRQRDRRHRGRLRVRS